MAAGARLLLALYDADDRLNAVYAATFRTVRRPGESFDRTVATSHPDDWFPRLEAARAERQAAANALWGYFDSDQPTAEERAGWQLLSQRPARRQP